MTNQDGKKSNVQTFLSWVAWPGLIVIAIGITGWGFAHDLPILSFNLAYILMFAVLLWLERFMPHEEIWRQNDGQIFADIAHTISSKGTVQSLLIFGGVIGLTELIKPVAEPVDYGIWPREWPMWAQAILGLWVAEFMLYWAHRLGHEVKWVWRFHAVHHSVKRLWVVNTGRFHFVDSLISILLGLIPLIAMGAPMEVIQWISAITAFIGVLTHCNVDMAFGPLSLIFNTPELHRWHHSKKLREGNKNYGENLMFWDIVFGTYFREPHRRPPVNIGITDHMPEKFSRQVIWPFLNDAARKRLEPDYVPKKFVRTLPPSGS